MALTGIIKDNDLNVFLDTVKFNHVTDFSLSIEKETIEVTSFDSSGWKDFLQNDKSWTASLTAYVAFDATEGLEQAFDDINGSSTNALLISSESSGDMTLGGTVHNTNVEISGSKGSAVTVAVSFQGTGALTKGTVGA